MDVTEMVGSGAAGAAGGLGAGIITFCHAKLRPGIQSILEMLQLEEA